MDQSVPIIYTPPIDRQVVTRGGRLLALGVAAAALTPLIIAATLAPDRSGMGTHLAMGFHRCEFLATTGLPCPSCGMTTSFAWFVRGNWLASLYVQPMGFLIALACGGLFWTALYIALTASPLHRLTRQLPGVLVIIGLLSLGIVAWGWKIFIHLSGIDGWR
jgi:hypothetical protein